MSSISDPIADLLTRIRNAVHAQKQKVDIPASSIKESIVKILKDEGFIKNYKYVEEQKVPKVLRIYLKYSDDNVSAITSLIRKSTPGRRMYIKAEELRPVYNNTGIWILSTSKGVITNKLAKKENVGGELICEIV